MKGVSYLTDDRQHKIAIQIDLKNHDEILNEYLEELEDIIDIKLLENEETIPWEDVKIKLREKGKIK